MHNIQYKYIIYKVYIVLVCYTTVTAATPPLEAT